MLMRRIEQTAFLALFVGGLVLCFYLPPNVQGYVCPLIQDSIRVEDQQNSSYRHERKSEQIGERTYHNANYTDQQPGKGGPLQAIFCGEMKFTDLALIFFTYCLVLVGWFTLRSNERNTESLERAYVFPGYSSLRFRNNRAFFTLVMTNTGRMPGIIKEVGYAFLERERLPRWRWQCDWNWEKIPYDWVIPADTRRDIRPVKSAANHHIFVMYIRYRDMFSRKTHTSWIGMYFRQNDVPNPDNRAGGDTWNRWD